MYTIFWIWYFLEIMSSNCICVLCFGSFKYDQQEADITGNCKQILCVTLGEGFSNVSCFLTVMHAVLLLNASSEFNWLLAFNIMMFCVVHRHMWSLVGVWAECGWNTTCPRCWLTCSRWHQTPEHQSSMWTRSMPGSVSCSCYAVWLVASLVSERRSLLQRKSASSLLSRWTRLVC